VSKKITGKIFKLIFDEKLGFLPQNRFLVLLGSKQACQNQNKKNKI
jgi:hypothetical protein